MFYILIFKKDSLNDFKLLNETDLVLQIGCIRLLICWLSHEALLEKEIVELMPKLIEFGEYYNGITESKESGVNLFEFLIPGLQRILIDLQEKLDLKAKFKVKNKDEIKNEFLETELKDEITKINDYLEKCYIYTD